MKILIVIPARFKSSRFPGKPLKKILGKEMILRVLDKCKKVKLSNLKIIVATDDQRIKRIVEKNNFKSVITSKNCLTGTDRVAEVANRYFADIYINVQGDEPLISPNDIMRVIKAKKKNPNHIICGYKKITNKENPHNINIPKVIFNKKKELIYISRGILPYSKEKKNLRKNNYFKQVCIYGFSKKDLKLFKSNTKSQIELHEDIEIIRFLEINKKVLMVETKSNSYAVDTKDDITRVEKYLKK